MLTLFLAQAHALRKGRVIPGFGRGLIPGFPRNVPREARCRVPASRAAGHVCPEMVGVAMRSLMRRTVVVTGAAVALLGPAAGAASAAAPGQAPGAAVASATAGWTVVPSPSPGSVSNTLYGVAATSSTNAWAVGEHTNRTTGQTLILHWNGTAWTQVPGPNPGGSRGGSVLTGVAATSSTNAWAIGNYATHGSLSQTLIEHWNGTAWTQVPSPNAPSTDNELSGVTATSATDAWAVGDSGPSPFTQALIVHWNGTAWTQVPSPSPSQSSIDTLVGVAATSARNAWAVGSVCVFCGGESEFNEPLIVHWNGTAWKQQPSPTNAIDLVGVAATSSTNAWAVGFAGRGSPVLIVHWNGTAWKQQSNSIPGSLNAVAATSATNVWAVGSPLIVHWNGTTWKQQPIPTPTASLYGVAATSATNAWAVGNHRGDFQTLVLHCC